MRRPLFAVVLLPFVWACACQKAQAPQPVVVAGHADDQGDPDAVVARIGTVSVTLRELNEQVGQQLKDLDEQQFEIRRQGLDTLINQRLVKQAAVRKGISEEQYLKEAVDKKIKAPSDQDVRAFFEQNSAQLPPGAKFEDFKDRIVQFLKRQAQSDQAKEVFVDLRKQTAVEVYLKAPPKPRLNVEAVGPSMGPPDAKVVIVEFSDFECPFCSRAKNNVEAVIKKYPKQVRLVFRQFPLSFHEHAKKAAEASLCANAQDKFWPYHDALFAEQKKLDVKSLKETAKKLGLNAEAFATCLDNGQMAKVVEADMVAGAKVGVTGTPAFFINGMMISGAQPPEEFARLIDQELTPTSAPAAGAP